MAMFITSPAALLRLSDSPLEVAVPPLEVTDSRDDYCTSEGDGLWIGPFLSFLEGRVAERAHIPGFQFSQDDSLDKHLLAEITSSHVRVLLVEFINAHYRDWRDCDVEYPDYDEIRGDCRDYCSECDSGWEEIHGEYDGPRAEDVPSDEKEDEAGISEEERQARHHRNLERRRERTRRREAQEEAEAEVVDRDFTCEDDCDGFCDHINDRYHDAFDPNTAALKRRWEEFLAERGETDFPPLNAEVRYLAKVLDVSVRWLEEGRQEGLRGQKAQVMVVGRVNPDLAVTFDSPPSYMPFKLDAVAVLEADLPDWRLCRGDRLLLVRAEFEPGALAVVKLKDGGGDFGMVIRPDIDYYKSAMDVLPQDVPCITGAALKKSRKGSADIRAGRNAGATVSKLAQRGTSTKLNDITPIERRGPDLILHDGAGHGAFIQDADITDQFIVVGILFGSRCPQRILRRRSLPGPTPEMAAPKDRQTEALPSSGIASNA